jgi:hypothetical protein
MKRLLSIILVFVIGLILITSTMPAQSQSGNTWGVDYYPNFDWAGPAAFPQTINFVNMNWGYNAPGPNMPADWWSARFNTDAYFGQTTWYFTIVADDEFRLLIDNVQVFSTVGAPQPNKQFVVGYYMSWSGNHHIDLFFREATETASVFLNWSTSGGTCTNCGTPSGGGQAPAQPLPTNQAPPLITDSGDYTPCMQNNWHQVKCFQEQWNLNSGSVAGEPQIQSWNKCSPPDSDYTFYVNPQVGNRAYRCSKTMAGYFPQ